MTAFGWPGTPCEEPPTYWYRYEDVRYSNGVDQFDNPLPGYSLVVELHRYRVHHATPKGVRLEDGQFVSNTTKKRFAHATEEEAIEAFKARKLRQIQIHEARIMQAKRALGKVATGSYIKKDPRK